eukprot:4583107-Amphidinium_carterae.1
MPAEQRRRQKARHARQAVVTGAAVRRPLLGEEAAELFVAIDRKEVRFFGVTRLSTLQIDELEEAPACVSWTRRISVLDYAAWLGRDNFV